LLLPCPKKKSGCFFPCFQPSSQKAKLSIIESNGNRGWRPKAPRPIKKLWFLVGTGASFGEAESLSFAPQRGAKKHLFSKKRTDKLFFY
jgi:hypothetical protein